MGLTFRAFWCLFRVRLAVFVAPAAFIFHARWLTNSLIAKLHKLLQNNLLQNLHTHLLLLLLLLFLLHIDANTGLSCTGVPLDLNTKRGNAVSSLIFEIHVQHVGKSPLLLLLLSLRPNVTNYVLNILLGLQHKIAKRRCQSTETRRTKNSQQLMS